MKTPKTLKATASAFGLARKATDVEAIETVITEARSLDAPLAWASGSSAQLETEFTQ